MKKILIIGLALLLILSSGCVGEKATETTKPDIVQSTTQQPETPNGEETAGEFSLTSTGFKGGENIPTKYTCDGADLSPYLSWGETPDGAESLALIVDDPDAPGGTFTHWVLFNLPASTRDLPEGVSKLKRPETGGIQGTNDFGEVGYNGPCPPPGKPHTYRFSLYALDAELDITPGATKGDVLKALEGHVLAETELSGKYGR